MVFSELTGYLYILAENGQINIVSIHREIINTFNSKNETKFTKIAEIGDKMLMGTNYGTV